ncbi:hypothetical protein [Labedaea rhizosphaerae]|uniref:Uncharacterized protein n=1 Tax=Labedaea rhizosphaerae TaxID=598644 RepID=A0A4R6SCI0_LABRH|nr:hypothetical protein [Labedaea rhizosphaerae]TDP97652.1 hypothetical protein EV186_103616 [Labedaea rhizosphaerae]
MATRGTRRRPAQQKPKAADAQPEANEQLEDPARQAAPTASGSTTGHGDDFAPDAEPAPEVADDGQAVDVDERSPLPAVTNAYRMGGTEPVQVTTVAGSNEPVRAGGFVLTEYGWRPESQLTPVNEEDADETAEERENGEDEAQAQASAQTGDGLTFLASDQPGDTVTAAAEQPNESGKDATE